MSRAGSEILQGRVEQPQEGHQEAFGAGNAFRAELQQQLHFDVPLNMAPDYNNQNADLQAMLGGFGIVNALSNIDNSLANQDAPQRSDIPLAQNDGPLSGMNAIGVLQNVLQGLSNVGSDAANSDSPPSPDDNGNYGGSDQPQPAAPDDQPAMQPSSVLPDWIGRFMK